MNELEKINFIEPEKESKKDFVLSVGKFFLIVLKLIPYFLLSAVLVVVVIILFLGIAFTPYYKSLGTIYSDGMEGKNHLLAAETFVRDQKLNLATQELSQAEESFVFAGDEVEVMKKSVIFKNDKLMNQLIVAEDIFVIGAQLSRSLKDISQTGQEVYSILESDNITFIQITPEKKAEILKVLAESTDEFEQVQKEFAITNEKLIDINRRQPMFLFNSVIEPLQQNIPKLNKAFDGLVTVSRMLPAFSGYPEEKTYLFLLQNNREMRPSGGFIGTYGELKLQNAEIKSFFTDNSYNLDRLSESYLNIPSPQPMADYMNQPKWFFRDSNWWPDFPMSAEKALFFYDEEGGTEKFDGVIAITPTLIEEVLGVLGEFEVGGLKFNKDNFWEQLEYQVEYGYYKQGIEEAERKDIIGELGKMFIAKIYTLPMDQWPELIELLGSQMQEKHLILYFKDDNIQNYAMEKGWTGEVKQFDADYVMLVDANLAALKTDDVMDRTMIYKIQEQEDGSLIAETRVNYQNLGDFSWKTTRYRTYTRLYVPQGSELISIQVGEREISKDEIDISREFDKTAFGLFFQVEPKTSEEIVWKYKLPSDVVAQVKAGEYKLLVQKQSGLPKMNLQLDLTFQSHIRDKESIEFSSGDNSVKHAEVLRADQIYTLWLK